MKIELILLLYDALLGGEGVLRAEFCTENSISERTFYRYIHAISAFLRRYKANCVIDILQEQGKYYLKNSG